jgi:hypothetical protein
VHPLPSLSRRELFHCASLTSLALASNGLRAFAQEKQPTPLAPLNRFSRTVHEWFVEQVPAYQSFCQGLARMGYVVLMT